MRRHLLISLAAAALVSGCAVGGDDISDTPRRDLAGRPGQLPTDLPTARQATGSPPAGASTGAAASATAAPAQSSSSAGGHQSSTAPSSKPAAPYRTVTSINDLRRDNDPASPGYADLDSVTIEDDGAHARVTVTVRGGLPAQTGTDEVMGIGVDLYRQGNVGRESDFQLFADGEPSGWYAYLETPKGFVRYPGQFALGGGRLVFTVPWSSVGGPRSGRFSAFVDWTRKASGLTGNQASNDYAPAVGTAPYAR